MDSVVGTTEVVMYFLEHVCKSVLKYGVFKVVWFVCFQKNYFMVRCRLANGMKMKAWENLDALL